MNRTSSRRLMATMCLFSVLTARSLPAQTPSAPPAAAVRPISENLFGQTVTDSYRWMENSQAPETAAWLKAQDAYTRDRLAGIPGRAALLTEIESLDNAGSSVSSVQWGGPRLFYLKTPPGSETAKLYVRQGLHGPERLLVDPSQFAQNGGHAAIDYFTPSWDGRYVAYGVSPGGSENSVLRVLDLATGRPTGEAIDRAQYGGVAWRLDNRSFFYIRLQKLGPGAPADQFYEKSRTLLHPVGTDPERDQPVLGFGLSKRMPLLPSDVPSVQVTPASPYVFAVVQHGTQHEWTIYSAPRSSYAGTATPWVKVADTIDGVTGFDAHGDTIYLLTHSGASRFRIAATRLSHPDFAHAQTVVPAGQLILTGLTVAADGLYVLDAGAGTSRLRRLPFTGGPPESVPLPYTGSVSYPVTSPLRPGLLFVETGWTHSSLWYHYDPSTHQAADTGLKPLSPVSFADITSEEVLARGLDGTSIPLSIVYKKSLVRDGKRPTLLAGYGAYGYSPYEPLFNPPTRPWLERGGVLAFAHVRGGGEFGEDWHRGGQKATKHNTWEDFIACGQYLIDHKFTSPPYLAGQGGSAGGIMVGRAMTARPDLWGAMISEVGSSNTLRQEFSPNGPPNIPEFGSVATADGFRALYDMDAYQHVRDGGKYPAMLLTTGINDPRVPPWEPAKMTARLQAASASGRPVLLRVDYDAGHGLGSTRRQRDLEMADEYAFLLWQFGDPAFQPKTP